MADLRLAVIFGGDKVSPGSVVYQASNTRPWKSYEAVAQDIAASLERIGFRNVQLMPDDMRLGDRVRREGIHMAWLNSGGVQGYNSAAHGPARFPHPGGTLPNGEWPGRGHSDLCKWLGPGHMEPQRVRWIRKVGQRRDGRGRDRRPRSSDPRR